jgi:single-strand DNA-binding protein
MAAGDTTITMIGNLVDDPELRFTPSGAAVAKFRVASTPRYLDKATNEWKDGESLFLQCQIWRQAAENVAESLTRECVSFSLVYSSSVHTKQKKAKSAQSLK